MCEDPKCKAHLRVVEAELKQAKILSHYLPAPNGRCLYHEDLSKGLWLLKGWSIAMATTQTVFVGLVMYHMFGGG